MFKTVRTMRISKAIAAGVMAVTLALASCGDFKPHPVTWNDIARTIPSNPDYIVSVNPRMVTDTVLNNIWATPDVIELVKVGLDLDTVKPSHFVVVSISGATYVTWPLPDPRSIAKKAENWDPASLNNTVDGRLLVRGEASLVLSSTQAWVVNSRHGENYVNDLLSAAMNTKAEHVVPYATCITSVPATLNAVMPYDGKYFYISLNHEDGLLRTDVDALNKSGGRLELMSGLGRLPVEFLDEASPVNPFAAISVDKGHLPEVIKWVAKLTHDKKAVLAANIVGPSFEDVSGTVIARWNNDAIELELPYPTHKAAREASLHLKTLFRAAGVKMEVEARHTDVVLKARYDSNLPPIDFRTATPHEHTQTENPSAVAFARFDIASHDPVDLYFELAPTHARLQLDFNEGAHNLAECLEIIKKVVFDVF